MMNKIFLNNIRNVYNKSSIRIDADVFRLIRRLGLGVQPPTRRGTRAGRLHRIRYCQPVSRSCDVSTHASSLKSLSPTLTKKDTCRGDAIRNASTPASTPVATVLQSYNIFLKLMYLNAQSCVNKALELAETIVDEDFDIVFLSETWLKTVGDEAKIAELTPKVFFVK